MYVQYHNVLRDHDRAKQSTGSNALRQAISFGVFDPQATKNTVIERLHT